MGSESKGKRVGGGGIGYCIITPSVNGDFTPEIRQKVELMELVIAHTPHL